MYNTIEEIEDFLLDKGLLKLDGYDETEYKTVGDFIYNFLSELNVEYDTVKLNGDLDTRKEKIRSLGDIFRITKYYIPDVTLRDVIQFFKKQYDNNLFVGHYCNDINKRIYGLKSITTYNNKLSNNTYSTWSLMDREIKDEFGHTLDSLFGLLDKKALEKVEESEVINN